MAQPELKFYQIKTGTAIDDLIVLEDTGGGTPGLPSVDGSQLTGISAGLGAWDTISTATTAGSNERILADTSGGAFTLTLPGSPSQGDSVFIGDPTGDWNVNNLTIDGNGNDIDSSSSVTLTTNNAFYEAIYDGTNWFTRQLGLVTPSSVTDNTVPRFDGTAGASISSTSVQIDDNNNLFGYGQLIVSQAADFTLAADDNGRTHECNKGSAFTINVPENSSVTLPVGFSATFVQTGSGQVSFSPNGSVVINNASSLNLAGQWSAATLYKRATNEWVLIGDLA